MKAMKCDYCGKFYKPYSGKQQFPKDGQSNGLMLTDTDERGIWNERESFDLCPDCMKKAVTMLGVKKDG